MGAESGNNQEDGKERLSDDVYLHILADNGLKEYLANLASRVAVVRMGKQHVLEVQTAEYVPDFRRFRDAMRRADLPLTDKQILIAICRYLDPDGTLSLENSVN